MRSFADSLAAERRLWKEFGFNVALKKLDAFQYRAEDTDSGLIEHEYLHVLHDLPGDDFDWRWSRTTLQPLSVDVVARVLLEQSR